MFLEIQSYLQWIFNSSVFSFPKKFSEPGIDINSAIFSISKFDLFLASKTVYLSPIIEKNNFPKSPSPGSFRRPPYFL